MVSKDEGFRKGLMVGIGIIVVALIVLLSMSVVIVPAGHKAVGVSGFGGIGSQYDEGFNFKNPFLETEMVRYNTQYIKVDTQVITDDGYNVPVTYQIQYNIDEKSVGDLRVNNPQYKEKIKMELESQITLVANKMNLTGLELNQNRAKFNENVQIAVKEALNIENLYVQSVRIRNVDMPNAVLAAAEKREAARIDVKAAQYELDAEEARAQKIRVRAASEANATVQLAEGQAEAIEILSYQSENMTQETMEYIKALRYIQALRDPESNVRWVITEGGQSLILDIGNGTIPNEQTDTNNTYDPTTSQDSGALDEADQ